MKHPMADMVLRILGGVAVVFAALFVVASLAGVAATGAFSAGTEARRLVLFEHTVHLLALASATVGVGAFATVRLLRRT